MKFIAVFVTICCLLIAQTSQWDPNREIIEAAKVAVRKNELSIVEAELDLSGLEAVLNGESALTEAKRRKADEKVNKIINCREDEVEKINRDYEEKYGNFTEQDEFCIETKDSSLSEVTDEATINITNAFIDTSADFAKAQFKIAHLDSKLKRAAIQNGEVIENCVRGRSRRIRSCLRRKLREVERRIDQVRRETRRLRECTDHINRDEDRKVGRILNRTDNQTMQAVDDYVECLKANLPNTTTSSTTTETSSTSTTTTEGTSSSSSTTESTSSSSSTTEDTSSSSSTTESTSSPSSTTDETSSSSSTTEESSSSSTTTEESSTSSYFTESSSTFTTARLSSRITTYEPTGLTPSTLSTTGRIETSSSHGATQSPKSSLLSESKLFFLAQLDDQN